MREPSQNSKEESGGFGSSLQSSRLHFVSQVFLLCTMWGPQNSSIRTFNGSISPKYFLFVIKIKCIWKAHKSDPPVSCVYCSAHWSSSLKWITCLRVQIFTELKYWEFAKVILFILRAIKAPLNPEVFQWFFKITFSFSSRFHLMFHT